MSLKKRVNHKAQHNKTATQLEKAGIAGLVISEHDGETIVTLYGAKGRALIAIQKALTQSEWLNNMVKYIAAGPQVNVIKPDGETVAVDTNYPQDEGIATSGYVEEVAAEPAGSGIMDMQPNDDDAEA